MHEAGRRVSRAWIELGVIALAALGALAPASPVLVEQWFSTRWYPAVQRLVTPLSNQVPFAVFDLLLIVGAGIAIAMIVRGVREARRARRLAPVAHSIRHLAALAACAYLAFLALWGANYRRVPMEQRLIVDRSPIESERVVSLGLEAARRMNALHVAAHATEWRTEPWQDQQLREAFATVQRFLSDAPTAVPGRLKWTILGTYFRWASVDGMVDPFALEVLANPDLLPWERPFVAAHEWGHLAGYADESEANFVGWLTSLRGGVDAQYSAWLFLYWQITGEVGREARERLASALDPGPKRDLEAIVDRLRRGQLPLLRDASWMVYDQYLKANRVDEGVRSYGAVLTLILQSRFEDDWTPVRRDRVPGS
jgi:hypothetical protein